MAKISLKKAAEDAQPKTYFSSEFNFRRVADISEKTIGATRYFIFLRPQENTYSSMVHSVKKKSDRVKFKNNPYPKIRCASFDEEGNRLEEPAICCNLYEHEKERLPERKDSDKRLIDYAKPIYHLPALQLAHCLTDPKIQAYEATHLKFDGSQFCFFEFSKKQWGQDILGGLATRLKKADDNTGESIIDPSLEDEELLDVLTKYLSKVVVRVDVTDSESSAKYLLKFSFIPFSAQAIAKVSGDRRKIVNWEKEKGLEEFREEVTEFLTLMEKEEPSFTMSWTPEELNQYIIGDEERAENIKAYKESKQKQDQEEANQVVEEDIPFDIEEEEVKSVEQKVVKSTSIVQKGEIEIDDSFSEEDFEFDNDGEEDFMGIDD